MIHSNASHQYMGWGNAYLSLSTFVAKPLLAAVSARPELPIQGRQN